MNTFWVRVGSKSLQIRVGDIAILSTFHKDLMAIVPLFPSVTYSGTTIFNIDNNLSTSCAFAAKNS
jgi:hypothetical protein